MITNFADHSANERTFLAWVRTAIAIVGFGLAAARLGNGKVAIWSEVLLLATAGAVVFVAYLRMLKLKSQIAARSETGDVSTATDTLLLLLVGALFALLAMFAFHVS
jgi:putative membrane protein